MIYLFIPFLIYIFIISANDTSSTEGITKTSKPFNTDNSSQFSTFESSPLPSRTAAILSQEQIYQKLGELTSSPLLSSLSDSYSGTTTPWSQETSTTHPSENIQFENYTIDASEYSSTTADKREENNTFSATEKLTTIINEIQQVEYGTEKLSSYNLTSLSAQSDPSITRDETSTELLITYSTSKTTKTPAPVAGMEDVPSSDQPSYNEETTTNINVYESTKSPAETTKFEFNNGDNITPVSYTHLTLPTIYSV